MLDISTTIKLFFLRLFETEKQDKESFFRSSLTLLSTIVVLILINFVIYLIYPDNSEAIKIEAKEIINAYNYETWVWPQPVEQIQAIVSIISIPILIFCNIKIFSSKAFNRISTSDVMYYLNVTLWFSFMVMLFYLALKFEDPNSLWREYWTPYKTWLNQEVRIFFKTITSELRFLITLIIFPLITYFIFNGIPKKYNKFINFILYSLILFFLLSMFLLSIFNRDNYIGFIENLNTVLYAVSQVQQGRTMLVDFTAQYGLYPHFLYPLFKLINVNVVSFSITMSSLTVISYGLILFGLRKIISNNLVIFFSFFAIIYFGYFILFYSGGFDLRYSINPIRMLFPALILFSVFSYIVNPKKLLYLIIIFISSLSVLWNFESGAICFLSFYIYVLYEKLADNNLKSYALAFIKHTIISASILTFTFLIFSLVMYLQSNSFPDWNLFFKYQNLYSITGFGSLPMPIFHAWNLVFLVYLYGIYIGLSSILTNNKNVSDSAAFFVAILGFGISIYFINRSHDSNLFPVFYPCFILLAIYLNKLLENSGRANLFRIKNFLSVSVISFVLVTIFIQMLQPTRLINKVADRIPDIINNKLNNQYLTDGVALINLNANPKDKIIILAEEDSVLYLKTNTSSPLRRSAVNSPIQSDHDKLLQLLTINISDKVFISGNFWKTGTIPDSRYAPVKKILDEHYYLDDWFGGWRMFVPKKYESITQLDINITASYSQFCPTNSQNCKRAVKNFLPIENFPTNTKFIKVDFNLSKPIVLQSIMLHIVSDAHYAGTLTSLDIPELTNIGILDKSNKQFINTNTRSKQLEYKANKKFSVLIPDSTYHMKNCEPFIIELIYNDNKKLKVRASCRKLDQ